MRWSTWHHETFARAHIASGEAGFEGLLRSVALNWIVVIAVVAALSFRAQMTVRVYADLATHVPANHPSTA